MSRATAAILTLQDASAFGYPMETIIEAVGRVLRVGRRDLISPHRAAHITEARHIFYWFARVYTARSYPEIGRFINRDHATVMYGVQKIEANKLKLWPKLKAVAQQLGVDLYERQAA